MKHNLVYVGNVELTEEDKTQCCDVYNIEKICQKNDNGVFIGEICTPTGNSTLIQQSYPEYRSIPIRSNYNNRRHH